MKPLSPTLVAVAIIAGVVGSAATLGFQHWTASKKPDSMPIAVVNLGGLIQDEAGGDKVSSDDISAGFDKMHKLGKALADKGYLVLSAESVIDAPNLYYVPKRKKDQQDATGIETLVNSR